MTSCCHRVSDPIRIYSTSLAPNMVTSGLQKFGSLLGQFLSHSNWTEPSEKGATSNTLEKVSRALPPAPSSVAAATLNSAQLCRVVLKWTVASPAGCRIQTTPVAAISSVKRAQFKAWQYGFARPYDHVSCITGYPRTRSQKNHEPLYLQRERQSPPVAPPCSYRSPERTN